MPLRELRPAWVARRVWFAGFTGSVRCNICGFRSRLVGSRLGNWYRGVGQVPASLERVLELPQVFRPVCSRCWGWCCGCRWCRRAGCGSGGSRCRCWLVPASAGAGAAVSPPAIFNNSSAAEGFLVWLPVEGLVAVPQELPLRGAGARRGWSRDCRLSCRGRCCRRRRRSCRGCRLPAAVPPPRVPVPPVAPSWPLPMPLGLAGPWPPPQRPAVRPVGPSSRPRSPWRSHHPLVARRPGSRPLPSRYSDPTSAPGP